MANRTVTLGTYTNLTLEDVPKGYRSALVNRALEDFYLKWSYDWECMKQVLRGRGDLAVERVEQIRSGEVEALCKEGYVNEWNLTYKVSEVVE